MALERSHLQIENPCYQCLQERKGKSRWKKIAFSYSKNKREDRSNQPKLLQLKNKFNINGVLYLWKLYLSEFLESINQIVNLLTVYLCTMPAEITISMCVVLAADAFYRAYRLKQPNTVTSRDRQIKIDIIIFSSYINQIDVNFFFIDLLTCFR